MRFAAQRSKKKKRDLHNSNDDDNKIIVDHINIAYTFLHFKIIYTFRLQIQDRWALWRLNTVPCIITIQSTMHLQIKYL